MGNWTPCIVKLEDPIREVSPIRSHVVAGAPSGKNTAGAAMVSQTILVEPTPRAIMVVAIRPPTTVALGMGMVPEE